MVHSKAVRKPLLAIIFNILMSMFFSIDRSKFGTIVKLYNMTKSANNNIMTSLHLIRLMLEPG